MRTYYKENTETLVTASKEIGLEVNADKTKYMVTSQDKNAGRSHDIKIDNSSFERVEQFRYLGTNLMNQNSIQEENTGLFISPSGTSELDCATTKKERAERSISIGRESLKVFFVLGALAYLQVPPLGGSRDEKWRAQ